MRIISSEIYSITDATFYDEAILGHKNTNWNANRLVVSETDNIGTLLYSENGQGHYWANNHNGITGSFACEFDLISYSDNNNVAFRIRADSTNDHYLVFKNINVPQNAHIKLIYDGTSFKYQIDDNTPVTWVTASYNSVELALRLYGAGDTLKYANFVVYPI